MKVLVTGGAGYIGSVTTHRLLAAGHEVVVVDDLSTGHADAVAPGAEFHQVHIADLGALLQDWKVEAVVHFAARSIVGESVNNPALYWRNNVGGTLALLEAVRAAGVGRFVFSSTAATYGDPTEDSVSETSTTRPINPYGATKLAVDLALADYAAAYGMVSCSLRYFNVAGALIADGVRAGERHTTETHLIPLALEAVRGRRPALSLFGSDYPTPDGTCIRDYIHVVDLADAHIAALGLAGPGHEVINLGSGTGYSVRQVLDTVASVTGQPVPVQEAPRRAGDPAVLVASNAKALDVLGWRPVRDLRAMVADAWEFSADVVSSQPGV